MNPSISQIAEASTARIRQAVGPSERRIIQGEHIDAVSRAAAEMIFAAVGATEGLSPVEGMEAVNNTQFVLVNVAKQIIQIHGLGEPEMTLMECAAVAERGFKARFAELSEASVRGGIA